MLDAFYEPDGPRFISTPWTTGPWGAGLQHAGPPSALLARASEAFEPEGMLLARITIEILRPIPVAPLRIETTMTRPGKKVQFVEAELFADDDCVARASAWRIRRAPAPVATATDPGTPPGDPERLSAWTLPDEVPARSYLRAMEMRFARGGFFERGPAAAWGRMRIPLVAGEPPSPTQRVLALADSGNGISLVLDMRTHVFINTELTVHLFREPVGEWVCLDAETHIAAEGVGIADSTLWDTRGRIGGGRQALFVDARAAGAHAGND